MGSSDTMVTGTVIYIVLTLAVAIPLSIYVRNRTKETSQKPDNFRLTWGLVILAGFCFWLLWICAFLHQLNPLVTPIKE